MVKLQRILFPTDFSPLSEKAMAYARSFAESFRAELHVLHVVDEAYQYWMAMGPSSLPIGPPPEEMISASRIELEKYVKANLSELGSRVSSEVILGRPFVEIVRYARDKNIDLIVLGTHGRGALSHVLLGSVAERVVRKAPCPVLTIRDPQHDFAMP